MDSKPGPDVEENRAMVEEGKSDGGLSPELREKLKEVESKAERPTQIRRIKRLQELQDKLEHSHKIKSLKNLEKKVLYPQIAALVILFPIILYISGASLNPFYAPLVYPLLVVFIWLLIIFFQWFFFRFQEIKHHPSKSAKCLMAKNSMQRAIPVVVIALIIFSLLVTPHVAEEVEARGKIEDTVELEDFEEISLVSKGRFGFRVARNLTIHCDSGSANVSLYEKETESPIFEEEYLEIGDSYYYADFSVDEFRELVLRFNSTEDAELRYEFEMKIHEKSRMSFAGVNFLYLAVFTEWTAIQYPIKKKYSGVGIYQ